MSESLKGFTLWRENSSLLLSMMSWCPPSLSLRGLCRAEETVCHSPGSTGGDRMGVTYRVVTQWWFLQKCSILRLLGVTNMD